MSKSEKSLISQAIKRIAHLIEDALLLSALSNLASGQVLSGDQVSCLGNYLNDPGCALTADEQGCVQQCLSGYASSNDSGGEDSGDSGSDDDGSASDDGGVLLRTVQRGGVADQAGLRAGDVILSFGNVRTRTFEDLQSAVQQANGRVKVVFINSENGESEYIYLEPEDGRIGVTCE